MSRYIDADVLKEQDFQDFSNTDVFNAIDSCPTADVAPVIHAHWIEETFYDDYGNRFARCSHCGKCEVVWDKYCRECGAKMDEKVE